MVQRNGQRDVALRGMALDWIIYDETSICMLTHLCPRLGWRRLQLRHVHGRMVDLPRHHAREFGFPAQSSRRGSVAYHQRGE